MRRLNGCACFVFALGFLAFGITSIVFGRQQSPDANADATIFRTDPSCAVLTSAVASKGACTVVDATVIVAGKRDNHHFTRVPSYTPYVFLRFADGTTRTEDLDGRDGDWFGDTVRPGAPARVLFFRGTLVRVVSGKTSAETISAPDTTATAVSQMPWLGVVLIVIGGLFAFGGVRSMR
jgi:hypothetical protein